MPSLGGVLFKCYSNIQIPSTMKLTKGSILASGFQVETAVISMDDFLLCCSVCFFSLFVPQYSLILIFMHQRSEVYPELVGCYGRAWCVLTTHKHRFIMNDSNKRIQASWKIQVGFESYTEMSDNCRCFTFFAYVRISCYTVIIHCLNTDEHESLIFSH